MLDAHLERARTTTVTKLLQGGADVNVTDDRGDTPLMYAAAVGSEAMMRRLIEASADVNAPTAFRPLPSCGAATACPRIRLLVEHGADVNVRSKQGHTPTKVAAHHAGNLEILKLLLSKGASLKVAPDEKGGTALANAADVNDTANRVPHELTAVRRFQAGEFYLRLSQGREIPIQDSSHPQPFRDGLSPAYFAEGDRSRRDHRPVRYNRNGAPVGTYSATLTTPPSAGVWPSKLGTPKETTMMARSPRLICIDSRAALCYHSPRTRIPHTEPRAYQANRFDGVTASVGAVSEVRRYRAMY